MATSDRLQSGQLTLPATDALTRSRSRAIFGLTVAAFTLVALALGTKLNLYIDELYSLHTTDHGFGYALQQAIGFEQQPPLFFLALTAWRMLLPSDFFARLFPICCSIATLFVVRAFGRRRLSVLPDWSAPLAVTLNPFFLWTALDVRVYAPIVLVSSILVTAFFEAFADEDLSLSKLAGFTLAAIAALYTQYFIGSLFVGFALTLLLAGPRRKIVPFVVSMAVVALACLPLLGILRHEFHDATVVDAVTPLTVGGHMVSALAAFVYPHYWIGVVSKFLILPYVTLTLFSLVFVLREIRFSSTLQRLVTIAACSIAFFTLVIVVARAPLEMPRHIATLFVPIVLLGLAGIAAKLGDIERRRALAAYVALLAVFSAADDAVAFRPPISNTGDWQRVGDFLNARVRASEPIAVFDTEAVLAVQHYYRGSSRIVALPHAQDFTVFDRRDFAIRNPAELAAAFPAPSPVTRRVWLVFGTSGCTIVEFNASCSILNSYLERHFNVVQEGKFNGTVVRELQVKRESSITTHTARKG